MGTVIQYRQRSNADRYQRWDRIERAECFEQYRDLQAQGLSQRQAAKVPDVPRSTLQAWQVYQENLDVCPVVSVHILRYFLICHYLEIYTDI